jgi:peptidoglycan hydrolase-like protein with peptidoglycan-binding domain
MRLRTLLPAAAVCALWLPAGALAATTTSTTTTTTSSSAAAPAPAPPVSGRIRIDLLHGLGHPAVALQGHRLGVWVRVRPALPDLHVTVRFTVNGHRAGSKTVAVHDLGNGTGQAELGYKPSRSGLLSATIEKTGFTQVAPARIRVLNPDLGFGAAGLSVRTLQRGLAALHYAVPQTGVYDELTDDAVIAYRKMTDEARVSGTDSGVFENLLRGRGTFHVRYPGDGKHVEADLSKQVLAEIDPGGRVHLIYTISSGKPSTPTVIGHFQVYSKTPGVNSEGMVDSNYFIRGYAIHGYASVPTYPASHGCLRIPIPDAAAVFDWVGLGNAVDVYYENGRGSSVVRSNAGP